MVHPNPESYFVLVLKNNIQHEQQRFMAHQIVALDEAALVAEAEPETPLEILLLEQLPPLDFGKQLPQPCIQSNFTMSKTHQKSKLDQF